eukprot:8249821-Alexandrium_andersonii.AAC.1
MKAETTANDMLDTHTNARETSCSAPCPWTATTHSSRGTTCGGPQTPTHGSLWTARRLPKQASPARSRGK